MRPSPACLGVRAPRQFVSDAAFMQYLNICTPKVVMHFCLGKPQDLNCFPGAPLTILLGFLVQLSTLAQPPTRPNAAAPLQEDWKCVYCMHSCGVP